MGRTFAGLGQASASGGAFRYIGSGSLDLLVDEVRIVGMNENIFAVKAYVLGCDDDAVDHLGRPFKIGDECSYSTNLDVGRRLGTRPEDNPAIRNIKAFSCALAEDTDPSEVDEAFGEQLVGPTQPAHGIIVHAYAVQKPKKEKKDELFTHVRWEPASPATYQRYAEQRAQLLGGHS